MTGQNAALPGSFRKARSIKEDVMRSLHVLLARAHQYHRAAVWAACFVALLCGVAPLLGEEPARPRNVAPSGSPAAKSPFALIDLKYIFEHYPPFVQQKEDMDAAVILTETAVKLRKVSIDKLKSDIEKQERGSTQRRELERTMAEEQQELQAQVVEARKSFLEQEAKIYRDVYQDVLQVVNECMREQGYLAVLRFNSDAADEESSDPQDIAQQLNKPVVAYRKEVDITKDVLRRLNQKKDVRVTEKSVKPGANK
jgi:Skp family chaperone for outer membrane proteins